MLQFQFNEQEYTFEIAENSCGRWVPLHQTNRGYSQDFLGFGGENQITIFSSGMQSGITHIMVVFSSVDSYHKVYEVNIPSDPHAKAEAVNQIIRQHETAIRESFKIFPMWNPLN